MEGVGGRVNKILKLGREVGLVSLPLQGMDEAELEERPCRRPAGPRWSEFR